MIRSTTTCLSTSLAMSGTDHARDTRVWFAAADAFTEFYEALLERQRRAAAAVVHGHAASSGVDSATTAAIGASGASGAGVSHSPTLGAESEVDVASTAASSKRRKRSRKVAQEEEHFNKEE